MQFRLQSCVDLNVSLLKMCFFWKQVLYTLQKPLLSFARGYNWFNEDCVKQIIIVQIRCRFLWAILQIIFSLSLENP